MARGRARGQHAESRHILVHGYADVDITILRDVLEHRTVDLLAFATTIRSRLGPLIEP